MDQDRITNRYSATWYEVFLEGIQPAQTELEIAFITRHFPNPSYVAVLDLCCGSGRHARLLAERGYRVTGVDLNVAALDRGRRLSGGQVAYCELDMRRLADLPGSFDAVINLWQSFGYYDEAVNADILRQIADKLVLKGRCILDIYHRGFFEQHQGTRRFERSGLAITETRAMAGNRLNVSLDYASGETEQFEWQLYTPDEIVAQAGRYGLVPLVVCTGYDERQPASADSPRMQVVFEKPETQYLPELRREYGRFQARFGAHLLGVVEIGSFAHGEAVRYSDHDLRLIIRCDAPLFVLNEHSWTESINEAVTALDMANIASYHEHGSYIVDPDGLAYYYHNHWPWFRSTLEILRAYKTDEMTRQVVFEDVARENPERIRTIRDCAEATVSLWTQFRSRFR